MLAHVGERAFADCTALTAIMLPNRRITLDRGVFVGCEALELLTVPDVCRMLSYRLDRWAVPLTTHVVTRRELRHTLLLAELADPETSEARKQELEKEIAQIKKKMRRPAKVRAAK